MSVIVKVLLTSFIALGISANAYTLDGVTVQGGERAEVLFNIKHAEESVPQIQVNGNAVEIVFLGAEIAKEMTQRSWSAVHPLIQSISVAPEKSSVKAKMVIAGTAEELKKRVKLEKNEKAVRLLVEYPLGAVGATASRWQDSELLPIGNLDAKAEKAKGGQPLVVLFVVIFLVLVSGGVAVWYIKNAKGHPFKRGSRKYLIEQVAYHSLGNRNGVSLLKIGAEFVLVGITPQNVTMLSTMPELKKRYDDESQFEREEFKVAVEDELGRLKGGSKGPSRVSI